MIKLSPYHEIFYNEWKLDPERSDYNIVFDNEMWGDLDVNRLHQALRQFTKDYLLLHSRVKEQNGRYYWAEEPELILKLTEFKLPQDSVDLHQYSSAPFNIETGPLVRAALCQLGEKHYRFIIVFHHLIMDGAKIGFVFESLSRYYKDPLYRFNLSIEEQSRKLNELSQHLENNLNTEEASHASFWRNRLKDMSGPDLRFLNKTSPNSDLQKTVPGHINEFQFNFDQSIGLQLQKIQRKYAITPYFFTQAVFALNLHFHTHQDKFALCYIVAVREGMEFMYGVHVSPTLIGYTFSDNMCIADLIANTKKYIKEVKDGRHHFFPLQKILPEFIQNNLLEAAFTQTNLKNQLFQLKGITEEKINSLLNKDCSGKMLWAQELKDNVLNFRVMYRRDIDRIPLMDFVEDYKKLLTKVIEDLLKNDEDTRLIDYQEFLMANKNQTVLRDYNKSTLAFPEDKTIHQLFEEQVQKTPDNIAVVFEDIKLTYLELNHQANSLALHLKRNCGVKPGDLVILCLPRCHLTLVAILAILKLGCAYVPVDPDYPDERIQYIIKDTESSLTLTDHIHQHRLTKLTEYTIHTVLAINKNKFTADIHTQSKEYPISTITGSSLAYIIYTSGTTGKPKGVMIEHKSVVNLAFVQANEFELSTAADRSEKEKYYRHCLGFANPVFDAHAWEYYVALLNGHSLYLVNNIVQKDIIHLARYIQSNNIYIATIPPILLDCSTILPLRKIIVAGEKTPESILKAYYQHGIEIINAYGPTEATVCTTMHRYKLDDLPNDIGKPIPNTRVYILDDKKKPMPPMTIGEIYIGGTGLARGYLNRPTLSQEVFISNPFQSPEEKRENKYEKLYKSGDLGRWLPSGTIEYVGRNDDQIKIRGHRVELEEIQNALASYPDSMIKQVAVLTKETTDKYLVAYYVSTHAIESAKLAQYLAARLPDYMLPRAYFHLKNFPLTINGKLDTAALPNPVIKNSYEYTTPTGSLEKIVCAAYAEVLNLPENEVGSEHDFFDIGGDSLNAIRLTAKLKFYFKIRVRDIFELKTPKKIARSLPISTEDIGDKIDDIAKIYRNTIPFLANDWIKLDNPALLQKHYRYLQEANQFKYNQQTKKIQNVLLTGATGHLGCHLLEKLLNETPYTIYLPVRANSKETAYNRINDKFKHYFDKDISAYPGRIIVFNAQIEETDLGLSTEEYNSLVAEINSVIHCAALVKHTGHYDDFTEANIETTRNLLELAKLTHQQDFHYISTVSVLLWGYIPGKSDFIFNEEMDAGNIIHGNNFYIQTKYQAELLTQKYRQDGVKSSIYRIGNLGMNSVTHRVQENINDNIFFSHCKSMIHLQMVPEEFSKLEISPVDCTALAIVKLFDKVDLKNQTHHVFNPHTCDLLNLLNTTPGLAFNKVSIKEFIKKVITRVQSREISKAHHLLALYQLWLNELYSTYTTRIYLSQKKTEHILEEQGFRWPTITADMLSDFVKKSQETESFRLD